MLVLKTMGLAGLVIILLGLTGNDYSTGRLELTGAGASSSIENSNDYAALLILLIPAIAYLTLRRKSAIILKICGLVALVLGCYLILSTGSRGALISIMLSTLYVLKVGSGKMRLVILVGLPLAALVAVPFIPRESALRLASLFSSNDKASEAAASQTERSALLIESIRTAGQHPLLGVGPGTFQIYQAKQAEDRGQRGMWHETHNSYTQVASECGIPALCFYLAAIILTFLVFERARKSLDPDIRAMATILSLMLVSFCVCMFFLSQAYGFGFPVLGGFAISLRRILDEQPALAASPEPVAA
jgi:O-antigen ligase